MNDKSVALRFENVSMRYGFFTSRALHRASFSLFSGEVMGILGAENSGKSTLLKLACGLTTPSSGRIFLDGKKPCTKSKRHISYMPDINFLPSHMSVRRVCGYFKDFYADFSLQKAQELLEREGIDHDVRTKELNEEKRRLLRLILAISREADLYLLDEPFGEDAPQEQSRILQTILEYRNPASCTVIATRHAQVLQSALGRIIFLKNGRISSDSRPNMDLQEQAQEDALPTSEVCECSQK